MIGCFKWRGKIIELISWLASQIKLHEVNSHREKSPSLTEGKRTMLRQVVIERPLKFISIWLCVFVSWWKLESGENVGTCGRLPVNLSETVINDSTQTILYIRKSKDDLPCSNLGFPHGRGSQ